MFHTVVDEGLDSLHDACGVMGISSEEEINIPQKLFYGLFSLQHRGQESAGIAYWRHGRIKAYRDVGMVTNALSHYLEEDHPARMGIGHVRYSTHGGNKIENAQPIAITCNKGEIALGHNGTISNSRDLLSRLSAEGSIFQSTTDTELLLHLIARSPRNAFREALTDSLGLLEGAYCFLMMHNDTMVAVRDPLGIRPLVMGRVGDMVLIASETCALDAFQPEEISEIEPGEMVTVEGMRTRREQVLPCGRRAHCIFELIYFARPDSSVFGYSVHMARKRMGEALARDERNACDLVIAVPDSGNSAALGYAASSGIPLEHGLTRNHYMGRTFIQPTKALREFGVRMKLHPVREAITGRRIAVIDDSLVRGTTSRLLVKLLRDAGAREVHLRLSSPALRFPCFYGIDIPTSEELISNRLNPEELADFIGADSVRFLSIDALRACVSNPADFCTACFTGDYPCPVRAGPAGKGCA